MEFLPSEIARLVLGYLEDEKCDTAYETFLTTSPNLTECLQMREMGKKFRTQVIGLTLKEILHEYSTIYYSVHERLKKVDPETADSLRSSGSLLDKLTFLLNANGSGQTMLFSITLPHGKSPTTSAVAHVRKKFKPSGLEKSKEKSKKVRAKSEGEAVHEDLSISRINPCDVDATPLCSLPGNNSTNQNEPNQDHENISRTPKRKNTSIRKSRANSSLSGVIEESLDFSVLTKVLIENHELHEKLAENINKVICTPENTNPASSSVTQPQVEPAQVELLKPDSTAAYSASFNNELDHMIKKVVEQTESDPLFENIIFEALVPSTEETSDDCEERRISNTSTPRKYTHTNDGSNSSDQDVNKTSKNYRLIHTRSKSSSSETNEHLDDLTKNIDDQNAVAIQSIIAVNSKQKELQENLDALVEATTTQMETNVINDHFNTITKQTTVESNLAVTKTTENVIVSKSSATLGEQHSTSNIVVISQHPPTIVSQPTYLFTTAHSKFPLQNQLVLFDNKTASLATQQIIIQQPQTNYPTLQLTERDIMTMPTVIMYGDDRNFVNNNITTINTPKYTIPQKILPKMPEDKSAAKLSITLYAAEDNSTTNENPSAKMDIKPVGNNLEVTISPVKPGKSVPMILNSETKTTEVPLQTPKRDAQPRQSLSTPRSAKSHIRALDFSTPSKESTSTRKANTSPKGVKRSIIKKPPNRNLKTSLFQTTTPSVESTVTNIPIATRTPSVKLCGEWDNVQGTGLILGQNSEEKTVKEKPKRKLSSWDEDLRALCSVNDSAKSISPKKSKKKATPKKKAKKKSLDLNKTEEQVSKIESALSSSLGDAKKEGDVNNIDTDNKKEENQQVKEIKKGKNKKEIVKRSTKKDTKDNKESNLKNTDLGETKILLEPLNVVEKKNVRNMRPRYKKKCNINTTSTIGTQNEQILCKIEQEDNQNSMTITLKSTVDMDKSTTIQDDKIGADGNSLNKSNVNTADLSNIVDNKSNVDVDKSCVINEGSNIDAGKLSIPIQNPQIVIERMEILEKVDMNVSQSKITPTNQRIINEQPITFKSNLTPILETPIKFDSFGHPITPKIFTPFSMATDTPFSKLLNENMGSVDLSSIATPSFPLTPNFSMNLTPGSQIGDAPYNRPTDYSTSSSYYQPSDTDQNQVMDQVLIEESKNMDKHKRSDKKIQLPEPVENKILAEITEVDRKKFTSDYILHEISLNSPIKTGMVDETKYVIPTPESTVAPTKLNETTTSDDTNINDSSTSSSSSSSDSSFTSSSSDESTDDTSNKSENTNNTVIHLPAEEVQTRYSLRTRKTPCKIDKKTVTPVKINLKNRKVIKNANNTKEVVVSNIETEENLIEIKRALPKGPIKIDKKINDKLNQPSTSTGRVARSKTKTMISPSLLNSLKEKRLRVMNAMKNPSKNTKRTIQPKKAPVKKSAKAKTKQTVEIDTQIKNKTNDEIKLVSTGIEELKNENIEKTKNVETEKEKNVESKVEIINENRDKNVTKGNKEKRISMEKEKDITVNKEKNTHSEKAQDEKERRVSVEYDKNEKGISMEKSTDTKKEKEFDKLKKDKKIKSKTPKKSKSIESVAIKLKELNGNKKESTPNRESKLEQNESKRKRSVSETDKEEEIPHLHISSDEEEIISSDVRKLVDSEKDMLEETERKKLEELKERGIHLIPKNTINTKKNSGIKIQNVVVLNKDKKIDCSKIIDPIKIDLICKKDSNAGKNTSNEQDKLDEDKKLDCSMGSYQFSLEDDAPLPAEANFEEFLLTENSPCFFKFVHDDSSICNRTLEDYDFVELSQKTISAQVFVSELDTLMTRKMSFSPYSELYVHNSYRKRIAPIRIENIKRIQTNRQIKKDVEKMENDTSKSLAKSAEKKVCNTKEVKKSDRKITNKLSLEQYKSKYREPNVNKDQIDTEEIDIYSDLPEDLSCKKRKMGSDVTDTSQPDKRSKSDDQRALLADIDLDVFLTKVHGPSET